MTPLRQRFIEDMQLRGLATTTQRSYVHYVADFAKFYNTSPEFLDLEAVRQYELELIHVRKFSPESINTFVSAVQFLYLVTLEMPWGKASFPRVKRADKLPIVLSRQEVELFFRHVTGLKYRAALMLCYGAGLRISEAVAMKVSDIDSQRMVVRIEEGKGGKDRYSMLSPRLLSVLRCYYRAARPPADGFLFPGWGRGNHLTCSGLSQACHDAAKQSGIGKHITAHTLRHYAASRTMPRGKTKRTRRLAQHGPAAHTYWRQDAA